METLDINILRKPPELTKEIVLEIQPLAPLSMVSDLPGSYYKTLKYPNKQMICGLFENILDWHISIADRKIILKELKKLRKKQKIDFEEFETGSSYSPLLMEYFEITLTLIPPIICHYDDYWSRAYRRADAVVHPKGTSNISFPLIKMKRDLVRNEKKTMQVDDKALESFFKEKKDEYPMYYSTPTKREYIVVQAKYQIKILIDHNLIQLLKDKLLTNNIAFLGSSEGWIDIKINEI